MRGYLHPEIYSFHKQGFTIPINEWFKEDLNDFVHDSIDNGDRLYDFFKPDYIRKLRNLKNLGSLTTRLWPVIVFSSWLNNVHAAR